MKQATRRTLRRASSSPDLTSDMAKFEQQPAKPATKRVATSPVFAGAKRVRVNSTGTGSDLDKCLFEGTRHARLASRYRPRPGAAQQGFFSAGALFQQNPASFGFGSGLGFPSPAYSPGVGPIFSSVSTASSSSSSSPLSDIFNIKHTSADMFVASISVRTRDRVLVNSHGLGGALLPRVIDQHQSQGPLAPLVLLLSQLGCPAILAQVGLAHGGPSPALPLSSTVSVSSQKEIQLRVDTSIYTGGVLMASHEDVALLTHSSRHDNHNVHEYSVPLAPEFLTRLLYHSSHDDTLMNDTTHIPAYPNNTDSLVLLRFSTQVPSGATKIVLVLACQFHALPEGDEAFVKLCTPTLFPIPTIAPVEEPPKLLPSPTIESSPTFGSSISTPSTAISTYEPSSPPVQRRAKRQGLTIAIPPASNYMAVGRPSPGLLSAGGPAFGTPLGSAGFLDVQQPLPSPLPITPIDKVLHTPLAPPPINRSPQIRASWVPTPTEASYPSSLFYFEAHPPSQVSGCAKQFGRALDLVAAANPASKMIGGALGSPWVFGFEAAKPFEFGGAIRASREL